jgi:hypothetical protein
MMGERPYSDGHAPIKGDVPTQEEQALSGNSMMMIPIALVILAVLVGFALHRHRHRNSARHERVEPARTDPSQQSTDSQGRHGGD